MNPNDLLAQQQAYMNQVMQNAQQLQWLYLIVAVVAGLIHFGLVYLFYARLREIADELRKIRVTYEMEQERSILRAAKVPSAASRDNPFVGDSRYGPKE